jgi:alpha-beta hydrolase superfamily lysophospholipase
MHTVSFALAATDGVELFVYGWLPLGQPKAVVQIVHGLSEHAGRYTRLAEALTASGYAVYACDLRGHGRTARKPEDLGLFAEHDGWAKCIDDVWQLNRHIATDHPGLPIVLLGHSMGSTLAEQFLSEQNTGKESASQYGDALAGVVLSGANGKPTALAAMGRLIARIERWRLGPRGHSSLILALTFKAFNKQFAPARTDFDWLSRDPSEVDQYVADPLCGFPATIQLWIDLLDAWNNVSRPSRQTRIPKTLPIYVIAGGRDPVSANTKTLARMLSAYRAAGLKQVQHRFYPEARHELFNETNRDDVTHDLISWLDSVLWP